MQKRLMTLIVSSVLLLSGCGLNNGSVISDRCLIDKPLTYSSKDTLETQREIMEYDAKGAKMCGWK